MYGNHNNTDIQYTCITVIIEIFSWPAKDCLTETLTVPNLKIIIKKLGQFPK